MTAAGTDKARRLGGSLEARLVAAAAFLVFTRVFAATVVLPTFREHGRGLTESDVLVGLALGAFGITMAGSQLLSGALSDRVGRRVVLVGGTLLFIAGSAWAATADSIGALVAARLVQGLGGVSSVAMAAVGETVPAERRTTAMAIVGVPAGFGAFLGFAVGPALDPATGTAGLFWLCAVLGVASLVPFLWPLPSARPMPPAVAPGWRVASLATAGFASNFAMMTVVFWWADLALGRWALAAVLLASFVVMGGAARVVDRRGATWQPVAAALVALAAGTALFVLTGTAVFAAAGALLFFSAHAVLSSTLPSQVSRLSGASGGRGHGIQMVAGYLGTAAGAGAAGFTSPSAGAAVALAGVVCVAALAAVLVTRAAATQTLSPTPL